MAVNQDRQISYLARASRYPLVALKCPKGAIFATTAFLETVCFRSRVSISVVGLTSFAVSATLAFHRFGTEARPLTAYCCEWLLKWCAEITFVSSRSCQGVREHLQVQHVLAVVSSLVGGWTLCSVEFLWFSLWFRLQRFFTGFPSRSFSCRPAWQRVLYVVFVHPWASVVLRNLLGHLHPGAWDNCHHLGQTARRVHADSERRSPCRTVRGGLNAPFTNFVLTFLFIANVYSANFCCRPMQIKALKAILMMHLSAFTTQHLCWASISTHGRDWL